jgi:flagellar basal-body rod modification protein FlgD
MYMTPLSSSEIQAFNAKGGTNAANLDPAAAQERFLKLFVAQLNNQDPLNPMDNAQMTSQMAQINTVTGIQQLNDTLKGMSTQLSAFQGMQGASLVGRQVLVEGNRLGFEGDIGQGAFSLPAAANAVNVDVMGTAGQVLGSINLGSRSAGMHSFDWNAAGVDRALVAGFKVNASAAGKPVVATTLSPQKVESVGMVDGSIRLRTESGQTVPYADVLAFM